MTPRDRVLSALRGEKVDKVPVSSVTQVGIVQAMEAIGATWPAGHSDPEKMVKIGVSLYKLAGIATARIPFCLTVQAEAMGCKVNMGTIDRQPSIAEHPTTPADQITVPLDFLSRGRIPAVIKGTELLKQYPDLPKMVGIEGPLTLAGHLVGIEKLMLMTIKNRDAVVKVVDTCTKANIEFTKAILDAGCEVFVVSDPSASPELMSPRDFASIVKPKLRELAHIVTNKGAIGVLHICGGVLKIIKEMAETEFESLSIEEKADVATAKATIGPKPTLVGNVSAARTLFSGTPEAVKAEAQRAIAAGIDVLGPGCGIAPRSPLDNVRALFCAAI